MTSTWTTKSGEQIPIRKLSDTHLINIVRMMERVAPQRFQEELSAAYSVLSSLSGEMATYYAEQEISFMEEESDWLDWLESNPMYGALKRELDRRGLAA